MKNNPTQEEKLKSVIEYAKSKGLDVRMLQIKTQSAMTNK